MLARMRGTEPVSLIRFHWYSQAGRLVPGTTNLEIIQRQRNPEQGPPYFLPVITTYGYFDFVGDTPVALYRHPAAPDLLVFQLGKTTVVLDDSVSTAFSPEFDDGEPLFENSGVARRFTVTVRDRVAIDFSYALNDLPKRLYFSIDPFPSWPDDETNYDLCYMVHRFMKVGTWRKVVAKPKVS
jgi:hypothetical protein